jgi:putative FmdB family regulatory protein
MVLAKGPANLRNRERELGMIYEYGCKSCEHRFEVWAKISDPAPESCPKCSLPHVEKVISATSFALKGSGWYTTDYKRPKAAEKSSE